jgi:hypothetical protein
MTVYRFSDNQLKFSDFEQPVGMKMSADNRWVKKAELIPWDKVEEKYAKLFTNKKGNVAKSLRLALGALIIQTEYGYSDEETVLQIQETAYLQFFCGYTGYDDSKPPFDPSLMVYFRKRLTPEILGEINELVIAKASEIEKPEDKHDDDNDNNGIPEPVQNNGTLIVDATCAPSNIKFPQDTELLNEAREKLEKVIDELHDCADGVKPRTYRQKAHKDHLNIARKKKRSMKEIRKAIGKQLHYIRRDFGIIDTILATGKNLTPTQEKTIEILKTLYEQQLTMHEQHTHQVKDRIVSLSQPWLRPIVRGKAKAPVEFGAKLDISISDGFVRLEKQSFSAYNEAEFLKEVIERYRQRTGHYPERVLADKIYRNRGNLNYCKGHGIRLSGPAMGRHPKNVVIDKRQEYRDTCERVEVERAFSQAKGKFGLGLIRARLVNTTQSAIALSILALNLSRIWCAFFQRLLYGLLSSLNFLNRKNIAFVQ